MIPAKASAALKDLRRWGRAFLTCNDAQANGHDCLVVPAKLPSNLRYSLVEARMLVDGLKVPRAAVHFPPQCMLAKFLHGAELVVDGSERDACARRNLLSRRPRFPLADKSQ